MIRRLRRKFILTNMVLVSLVLAAAFGCLLFSTSVSVRKSTESSLRRAVEQQSPAEDTRPAIVPKDGQGPGGNAPPDKPQGDGSAADSAIHMPQAQKPDEGGSTSSSGTAVFWVLLDADGNITDSDTDEVSITEDTLRDVAAAWQQTGAESGILPRYDLRYLAQHTPEGWRVAFADRTAEWQTLWTLAERLALVGLCALIAFWGISALLAQMSLQPVEQAWRQQRQFVADASHELKTPLTVIMANADLDLNHPGAAPAQHRQWMEGIRDEADRMYHLVEDMLFLAKADALRKPDLAPVDLSTTVESEALSFDPVAYERGVALETDITPGLTVQGDAKQLAQLAAILLDNACKYAGPGGQAGLQLRRRKNTAVLRVANTGETLSKEEQAHLFERFYRTDAARTRGGYGLGLAIAQSITAAHNGNITVDSQNGKTTFTVTFPLKNNAKS